MICIHKIFFDDLMKQKFFYKHFYNVLRFTNCFYAFVRIQDRNIVIMRTITFVQTFYVLSLCGVANNSQKNVSLFVSFLCYSRLSQSTINRRNVRLKIEIVATTADKIFGNMLHQPSMSFLPISAGNSRLEDIISRIPTRALNFRHFELSLFKKCLAPLQTFNSSIYLYSKILFDFLKYFLLY